LVARSIVTAKAALGGVDLTEGDNPGHGDRRLVTCRHWTTSFLKVDVGLTLPALAASHKT